MGRIGLMSIGLSCVTFFVAIKALVSACSLIRIWRIDYEEAKQNRDYVIKLAETMRARRTEDDEKWSSVSGIFGTQLRWMANIGRRISDLERRIGGPDQTSEFHLPDDLQFKSSEPMDQ